MRDNKKKTKTTSITAHTDWTRATVPHAQSIIALYTELHAECYQQSAIVVECRPYVPCTSAVRPPAVAVYIALADSRCAVAKFSKSRVWNKVPERSTIIFGDALISINTA